MQGAASVLPALDLEPIEHRVQRVGERRDVLILSLAAQTRRGPQQVHAPHVLAELRERAERAAHEPQVE